MNTPMDESPRDLLLSRIVDRQDEPVDWQRFEVLADADGRLASDLIDALRVDATLRSAVGAMVGVADTVAMPGGGDQPHEPGSAGGQPRPLSRWWRTASHWGGWLAAAVFLLCWMATDPSWKRGGVAENAAGSGRPIAATPVDPKPSAVEVAAGAELLQELPNLLVETRPIPNSDRMEVVFVRRSVQRTVVSDLYSLGRDENGTPFEARVDLARFGSKQNY